MRNGDSSAGTGTAQWYREGSSAVPDWGTFIGAGGVVIGVGGLAFAGLGRGARGAVARCLWGHQSPRAATADATSAPEPSPTLYLAQPHRLLEVVSDWWNG